MHFYGWLYLLRQLSYLCQMQILLLLLIFRTARCLLEERRSREADLYCADILVLQTSRRNFACQLS